jgi:uncharacterized membrane protein (UPF0182 family)
MRRAAPFIVLATLLIAGLVAAAALTGWLVDWLWFDAVGFGAVFATMWHAKLAAFTVAAVLSAALLAANGLHAARAPAPPVRRLRILRPDGSDFELPDLLEFTPENLPWRALVIAAAALLGVLIGAAQAGNWELFLEWMYGLPFARTDPLFGHDLGLYVFALPGWRALRDLAFLLTFLSAAMALGIYWVRGGIDVSRGFPQPSVAASRHLSVLLAVFFLLKAGDYVLQRYDLLLGDTGVVFGAAYTDVHVRLPLLAVLIAVCVAGALLSGANLWAPGFRLPVAAIVLLFATALFAGIVPDLYQSYRVKPDELRLEAPYIEHNIALTRYGFALDRIGRRPFPAAGTLSPAVLAANDATIQNLRWWDPRPLLDTYRQLQELRLYYDFHDIDIDRYTIEGASRQVMLSARELDQRKLPGDAQTWINQHFKFTHGIGVAMSPVNRFDEEGLPLFYVKDIPPASPVGLRVDRPELYFGEETRNYVVVRGGTSEFDYAKGQENVYTTYAGRAGVALGTVWRRALFAWYFGDLKLLISGNVTGGSRILFRRLIRERVRQIAPFLLLDRDPYIVLSEGRLVWMQDAYTASAALPYAQPNQRGGINYIRNAVKIVIDAYDGTVVFYLADPSDPIARTYQRIFPTLFQPLEAMPAALRQHIRYPEDLFILQAGMYGTYHMTDPEVFYNKEDLWSFPQESYSGETITMAPYYVIMRLPGEAHEEFILMLPMVPNSRDNMIAWLAARCDGEHYGTLIEYAFPKEKLVFGPAQIEARIDQDTTISQQLSLWNQTGSRVIRGNLLVIPIDDALLYVEPLYLRAERRELPELKRLIASAADRVVMSQGVDTLLAALFTGEEKPPAVAVAGPGPTTTSPAAGSVEAAREHYRRALDALRGGNWQEFGSEMDALQKALEAAGPPS